MKMSNNDVIALTEVKFYFLDPPYTFKLAAEALSRIDICLELFSRYPTLQRLFTDEFEGYKMQVQQNNGNTSFLRKLLPQIAARINEINQL